MLRNYAIYKYYKKLLKLLQLYLCTENNSVLLAALIFFRGNILSQGKGVINISIAFVCSGVDVL